MKGYASIAILFLLFSCTSKRQNVLSPSRLPSFYLTVNVNTDSTFHLPKGGRIKIEKGTFHEETELEIKEAYTIQDMILGGLVTESNKRPLISGGMIYINEKNRKPVPLSKPVTIEMPASYVDPVMNLYAGDESDESVNWILADTLPDSPIAKSIATGKQLFISNCTSCHSLDKNMTGPALRHFTSRGNWKSRTEVYKWIHNPARYMASDPYTNSLRQKYGGVVMQAFPNLSIADIDAIIEYLENEEANPLDDIVWINSDSSDESQIPFSETICSDTIYFNEPDTAVTYQNQATPDFDYQAWYPENANETVSDVNAESNLENLEPVLDDESPSRAYIFKIASLGWYNIDGEVLGRNGTLLCDLKVKVLNEKSQTMNVYIFFPRYKGLSIGTESEDNTFLFEKIDGKIPLFVGAEGFALVFGTIGDDFYYGTTSFSAKPSQIIEVSVKKSTEEAFLKVIEESKMEGIKMDLEKQKMRIENRNCSEAAPMSPRATPPSDICRLSVNNPTLVCLLPEPFTAANMKWYPPSFTGPKY